MVAVAALSWSTLSRVGLGWFAVLVAVLVVGGDRAAVVSWYNTGYHIVGRELRIHEGLLWRRTRAIPLERLQAVEVVRPLLAQLTGLAELRLEVVGGGQDRSSPGVPDGGRGGGPAGPAARPGRPGRHPYRTPRCPGDDAPLPPRRHRPSACCALVANRELLVSQLLTPQAFFLPIGVASWCVQFLIRGSWSFIAVASTLTAMAGIMLQPIRRVLSDWNFRLSTRTGRLRVRHGLLETRAQTVPLDRVQAVAVTWPLLWRAKRVAADAAGRRRVRRREPDDDNRPDRLLPVGDLADARFVTFEVLPGVDLTDAAADAAAAAGPLAASVRQPVLGAGLARRGSSPSAHGLLTRELARAVRPDPERPGGAGAGAAAAGAGHRARRHRRWAGAAAHDRDLAEAWTLAAELAERARRPAPRAEPDGPGRAGVRQPGRTRLSCMEQQRDRSRQRTDVFTTGLTARVELTVTDADTAQAVGSGDVPVLGTPRVLALAEAATVAATAPDCRRDDDRRARGWSWSTGRRPDRPHRVAAGPARQVDGRRLVFEVLVTDGQTTIAEGRVERVAGRPAAFVGRATASMTAPSTEVADRVCVLRHPVLDVNVTLIVGAGEALLVDTLSTAGAGDRAGGGGPRRQRPAAGDRQHPPPLRPLLRQRHARRPTARAGRGPTRRPPAALREPGEKLRGRRTRRC